MDPQIERAICRLIDNSATGFVTVNELIARLPAELIRKIGLDKRRKHQSQTAILEKLLPPGEASLVSYRKAGTRKIGYRFTEAEIIIRQLQRTPDLSAKRLKQRLPVTLADYCTTLNQLLAKGVGRSTKVNQRHEAASLCLSQETGAVPETGEEKARQFRAAYLQIGGGNPYVFIHRLRRLLRWPRAVFDAVLLELSRAEEIMLQGGDPSKLTREELADAFLDPFGYQRITVSWRKKP